MNNREQLAEEITTGEGIGKYIDKPPRIANFLLGYDKAEELYKGELQTATNLLIRLKNLYYQGGINDQTSLYNEIWEFLRDKEYNCSKNGIKREGESCTLNNNCIYPKCLK